MSRRIRPIATAIFRRGGDELLAEGEPVFYPEGIAPLLGLRG